MSRNLMKRAQQRKARDELRKELNDIAWDEVKRQWNEQARKADITILYTLHTVFGFGKKRCERFYKAMIKNHFRMVENWQCNGDDSHYWIMENRLKDADIDIKALQEWADTIE